MEMDKTGSVAANDKSGTVLVVDDMEDVLFVVGMLLERSGYRVLLARNATDGLGILGKEPVDLVLSDVNMPEYDGLAFLKEARQCTQDVPVVLMTGGAHLDMAVEAIRNGAFDLIIKPLGPRPLHVIVERALRHRRLLSIERNYHSELERTVEEQTRQLREALRSLDKFHNQAKSYAEERSEFLSTLTHELRTPMNGIVCPLSMLAEAPLSDDDRELLDIARVSADNMMVLVDQLLSFADSGKSGSSAGRTACDLRDLLSSRAKVHDRELAAGGIELTFAVDAAVPATVACDRELIARVLDILVGNALKFTETGAVSLTAGLENDAGGGDLIHFQVIDTGIGIPEQMLESVFEQFFQVDGSLTRRHGGLGLGLSQARRIVQHLGGRIWAESVLGTGSTFHVELPCYGP